MRLHATAGHGSSTTQRMVGLEVARGTEGGGHGGVPWTDPRWVNHHVMGPYHDVTGLMNTMEYSWDIRDLR